MRLIPLAVLLAYPLIAREPLAKRIVHTDPTKYSREAHVHEGAGEMQFEVVTGRLQLGNPMVPQGLVSRACWRRPSYDLIRLRVPKHQENIGLAPKPVHETRPPPLLTRDLQHP